MQTFLKPMTSDSEQEASSKRSHQGHDNNDEIVTAGSMDDRIDGKKKDLRRKRASIYSSRPDTNIEDQNIEAVQTQQEERRKDDGEDEMYRASLQLLHPRPL